MDILINAFLYWIVTLFCPNAPHRNARIGNTEIGAAYFFSTAGMDQNDRYESTNDHNDGPNW